MKLLGLAPGQVFSGFETTFFRAIEAQGIQITPVQVEIPWFKIACTFSSFYPRKKIWATRRDRHYHASIAAFIRKSGFTAKLVEKYQDSVDAIYQVGGLWNPVSIYMTRPLILQVDYTSILSARRNSEWKRKPGRAEEFWIEQERRLYDDAIVVLTTTENARQSIINDYGVDSDHVVTVGAGVSPPYDQLDFDRTPAYGSKKILFVGKGFLGKGLDTVLEAFELLRVSIPEATLTVVGPTEADINSPGVNYMGRIVDRERVRNLYFDHALFVMPSRFEPLGQVFLEAMSCQLPCIGTTVDAMPEIIDDGITGFVIEPGDAQQLARYMEEIISRPDRAATMGRAGYNRLTKKYTWPVVGKKIADCIRTAVPQKL